MQPLSRRCKSLLVKLENDISAGCFGIAADELEKEIFCQLIFDRHNLRRAILFERTDRMLIAHEQIRRDIFPHDKSGCVEFIFPLYFDVVDAKLLSESSGELR